MKPIPRIIPILLAAATPAHSQDDLSSVSSGFEIAPATLTTARILGEIPDGMPPPQAPPKPEYPISKKDILSTATHEQGGRTITIREINPIALPPPPAPVKLATAEADAVFSQRVAEYREEHPRSCLLFLGATVFRSKDSPPRTLVRYWPEGGREDITFWSSADFALIAGGINSFVDAAGDSHHILMGWGNVDIDRMAELYAAKGREYDAPVLPEFAEGSSDLYNRIISPEGFTLFLKRAPSIDEIHTLSLELLKKEEWYPDESKRIAALTLLPCEIVPDWNRDGKIDLADHGKVTSENPWRFWINDDDDSGETGGDDVSRERSIGLGGHEPDYVGTTVDGIRDLVDFFPVHLDIKAALEMMPDEDFQYYLKCESSNVAKSSFHVIFHKDGDPEKGAEETGGACAYLKRVEDAMQVANMQALPVRRSGLRIPDDFLDRAAEGMGVALLEGVKRNTSPLVLRLRRRRRSMEETPHHRPDDP